MGGFSLHGGVATQAHQRKKLERICCYVARPAVSEQRLALTRDGRVRYELKTPYRDGTTHVIFEPLVFMYRMYGMPRAHGCAGAAMARLAALVPKPRVNLTRFHGVFAPNSEYRMTITPARRGRGASKAAIQATEPDDRTPLEQHAAMTWARRLKRVFAIDITVCEKCKGPVRIIACIEESLPRERSECSGYPVVIEKILAHLNAKEGEQESHPNRLPPSRAPPQFPGWDQGLSD